MNPEIKAKWIKKLESGQYKQTRGVLRRGELKQEEAYCCLGVLCELYKEETDKGTWEHWKDRDGKFYNFNIEGGDNSDTDLPSDVVAWAGLSNSSIEGIIPGYKTISAVSLNDFGLLSFTEIAEVLRTGTISEDNLNRTIKSLNNHGITVIKEEEK